RAARMQGDYASVFAPVAGYDDVANGKAHDMTGLKKIDDYSFSATLTDVAAYWYTEVALWTAWVVDQKVIKAAGKEDDQNWASDPATAVGTGMFKMTARTPKTSTDFAPVANWWGGSTGAITKVHIEIIADQKAQLTKYESGGYSLIGYNTDPWAVFDKAKAQQLYKQWDPDGSKVKNLVYTHNTSAFNKAVCENLASQWKANLNVTMQCTAQDTASFFHARTKCTFPIFRHSWGADYDHPQDWFDFLFVTDAGSGGACYSNPQIDQMEKSANSKPL